MLRPTLIACAALFSGGTALHAQAQAFAYVTNLTSDNVTVIDTSTDTVVATIPVGDTPQGVVVHPLGHRAYVANRNDDTVSVIDTSSNTVIATIGVGDGPVGMEVTIDGGRLLVTNFSSEEIAVIDTGTNAVQQYVDLPDGSSPWAIAVHPGGAVYYVGLRFENRVSVRSTADHSEVASIPVGTIPVAMAVHPYGTALYVSNLTSGTVSVIDTATNAVIRTHNIGNGAWGVTVHPTGAFYYVAHNEGQHRVFVYDGETNDLVASPAIGVGVSLSGIAAHPNGSKVYVAGGIGNRVEILDTATNTFVGSVPAGLNAGGFGRFVGPPLCGRFQAGQARVCLRNAGTNPISYSASPPVIGDTFTATVDNNVAGQTTSFLVGFSHPATLVLPSGQALLVLDPGGFNGELLTGAGLFPSSSAGGVDSYSLPVVNDPAFIGLHVYTQAVQMGGGLVFSNAQDLVVGSFR